MELAEGLRADMRRAEKLQSGAVIRGSGENCIEKAK
jgi:hypothetical protein